MIRSLIAALALAPALAAFAAPMTNEDVIRMVKGGLGEATLMQAIDGAEPGFDTSPDGLVRLKQGGVSDKVIQHIISRKGSATAADGAVAGHMIEKQARSGKTWEIGVRLDDGRSRVFLQDSHPAWSAGTRVRVVNGALAPL